MSDEDKPSETSLVERLYELLNKSPFEKFKVTLTSGSSYLIERPGNLAMGKSRMTYYVPKSDRAIEMRLNQVSEVEQTGKYVEPGTSGNAKRRR